MSEAKEEIRLFSISPFSGQVRDMSSSAGGAAYTPPALSRFFIFNPKYGPREDNDHEKILFYHPSNASLDAQMKDVGLAEALTNITKYVLRHFSATTATYEGLELTLLLLELFRVVYPVKSCTRPKCDGYSTTLSLAIGWLWYEQQTTWLKLETELFLISRTISRFTRSNMYCYACALVI